MPALIERPKMSLAMWAALKTHIMKQRERKKQEQEADEAVERLRREQEMKRKQNAMTLEEIREQLAQLEKKLQELRVEKHEMFLCLKRVLNEDDKRRNEEDKEPREC
ncbi:G protein pathway suppressor 2-like isoform X2 [Stegodyphus dumicola]|uniref:G protein pathway suppressor 2-like isoform X2 n=1 Tax=Stegodyphus dumicola TaxID=202533 RepID=UPI0015B11EC4|nr:G protein pathway suppressor 2-like isoform X2 [Stegodyphus dumicola]